MRMFLTLALTTAVVGCGAGDIGGADTSRDESNPDSFLGDDTTGSATGSPAGVGGGQAGSSVAAGTGSGAGTGAGAGASTGSGGNGGPVPVGVTVHLEKVADGAGTIPFGVPVAPGSFTDVSQVRVRAAGVALPASVKELLGDHDESGARVGVRSFLVQLPASVMGGTALDVDVSWAPPGDAEAPGTSIVAFASADLSVDSPMVVSTTVRTIVASGGVNALVDAPPVDKTLFVGREARVIAQFPEGYLASTGILGQQRTAAQAAGPDSAGLAYLSGALADFGESAMYEESYALNPAAESVIDPISDYSGWLYDRCATFLTAYTHLGDARFLRHAYRSCSHFAGQIELDGPERGIFRGKPEVDTKYSHLRGLYVYYALTGDETAFEAGRAVADMWLNEPNFVLPYRAGHVKGVDKLWTERLLATSMEGLIYGHRLTGDVSFLQGFREIFDTGYMHITGDAAALASINPGVGFPPQNCFIHTGEQHADAGPSDPWCSPWMSELMVDPLLRYQELTGDDRVDEVFVRLGRFLRDVGTVYFESDPLNDNFMAPSACDDPAAGENRRRLVPLYGAGLTPQMARANFGEWSDFEHCADATALTAAALRALKRQGTYDQNPVGPFASEGESMLQLHHELSSCAERTFKEQVRLARDPASWSSDELAAGVGDPAAFIQANKIGYPLHVITPQRKISWWFNTAMLQLGMLDEAGVSIPALHPGTIQPSGCN